MNLWRKAPWRGTYKCESPFRLVQLESFQRRGKAGPAEALSQPELHQLDRVKIIAIKESIEAIIGGCIWQ